MSIMLLSYLVYLSTGLTSSEKDTYKTSLKTNDFSTFYDFNITRFGLMPSYLFEYVGKADKPALVNNGFDVFENDDPKDLEISYDKLRKHVKFLFIITHKDNA